MSIAWLRYGPIYTNRWIFPVVPEHAIGGLTTRYRRSHTTVGTNAAAGCVGGAHTIYKDTSSRMNNKSSAVSA